MTNSLHLPKVKGAKIKKTEYANLLEKVIRYNRTVNPETKQGSIELYHDIQSYAKLVMRRHSLSEKEYVVDVNTAMIVKRTAPAKPLPIRHIGVGTDEIPIVPKKIEEEVKV